jgi:hypothetical protein
MSRERRGVILHSLWTACARSVLRAARRASNDNLCLSYKIRNQILDKSGSSLPTTRMIMKLVESVVVVVDAAGVDVAAFVVAAVAA